MLFNSIEFAFFLPIVFTIYWFVFNKSLKIQNGFLLYASYYFYFWWDWRFLSLIALSTIVDYIVGLRIESSHEQHIRKRWLQLSLGVNLGILGFFKYYNFFIESWVNAFAAMGYEMSPFTLQIILPVGISFYTFQTLSYSIDIYRKKLKPTKDFIAFAAFVSFFPQLVAGPIERARNLLPQFKMKRVLEDKMILPAINMILWGLFKKIGIADRIAPYVNEVFSKSEIYSSIPVLIAVSLFAVQIYCDFSGYSDIARGVAALFGFRLMENFRSPYLALSLNDFWHRWHISLSTWFRDYVYIPLGGNRVGSFKRDRNILITFGLSGLWHGANWTFLVWGLIHGIALLVESRVSKLQFFKQHLSVKVVKWCLTMLVVNLAWVFFRADDLTHAFSMLGTIMTLSLPAGFSETLATQSPLFMLINIFVILIAIGKNVLFSIKTRVGDSLAITYVLIILIYLLGTSGEQDFIYFQF